MAKPELDHMVVRRGEKGGHMVEHHFAGSVNGSYKPPMVHIFGKSEGAKMLGHIAEHMEVSQPKKDADGDYDE